MSGDDIDIELEERDPVGDVETRSRQTDDRVTVPEKFWDHLGIDKGERMAIVCKDKSVELVSLTKEKLLGGDIDGKERP